MLLRLYAMTCPIGIAKIRAVTALGTARRCRAQRQPTPHFARLDAAPGHPATARVACGPYSSAAVRARVGRRRRDRCRL